MNGAPPSDIPKNLQANHAVFKGTEATELPCINFVREIRTVQKNLNKTLAALRLCNADSRHQLLIDGISRRHIVFQTIVVAVVENGVLDPVIVSSCMVLESETSKNQVKFIMDMASDCLSLSAILP